MTTTSVWMAVLVGALAVTARAAVRAGRRSSLYRLLGSARAQSVAGPIGSAATPPPGVQVMSEAGPILRRHSRRRTVWPPSAPARLVTALHSAGVDVGPDLVWRCWLGAGLAIPVAAVVLAGVPAGMMVTAAIAAGPVMLLRARRGTGDARLQAALPEALEAVARSLRSGSSLLQAVEEAGSTTSGALGSELRAVAARARRGSSLVDSLDDLAARRPIGSLQLAVSALCLGIETGGAQAQAVDGVAATIRDRHNLAAEVRALSSQARASAAVMGLSPIGFGVFAGATDPRTATFLLHTPLGLAFVAGGLVLDAVGWLWMRRLSSVAG